MKKNKIIITVGMVILLLTGLAYFIAATLTDANPKSALSEIEKAPNGDVISACKYTDKNGNTVLEPYRLGYFAFTNDDATCSEFSEGLLLVVDSKGKWIYIDKDGAIKVQTEFNGWGNGHDAPLGEFKNGIAEVYLNDEFQGHINKNGKFIRQKNKKGYNNGRQQ